MAGTTLTEAMVAELMAELAALEDPMAREVNEKHGDDHSEELRLAWSADPDPVVASAGWAVSAWRYSRTTRLPPAARLRSRPFGSPRWCADSTMGRKVRATAGLVDGPFQEF